MLLGAAKILEEHRHDLQPAEEGLAGAKKMIEEGALKLFSASWIGGNAFNVIPDSITIGGTLRAFTRFTQFGQRIKEVITKQATVHRCNASVNLTPNGKKPLPPAVNNMDLYKQFKKVVRDLLGQEYVVEAAPVMGSEDFSFFAEAIPGHFFLPGMQDETKGYASGHSPLYRVNEDVLPYGTTIHASMTVQCLRLS